MDIVFVGVVLIALVFIGTGAFVANMIVESIMTRIWIRRIKALAASPIGNTKKFRDQCLGIGIDFDEQSSHCLCLNDELIEIVENEKLDLQLGIIIGRLLAVNSFNPFTAPTASLLQAITCQLSNRERFWAGVERTNKPVFEWHKGIQKEYHWREAA